MSYWEQMIYAGVLEFKTRLLRSNKFVWVKNPNYFSKYQSTNNFLSHKGRNETVDSFLTVAYIPFCDYAFLHSEENWWDVGKKFVKD